MINLKEKYNKEVVPVMMEKFGYKSKMAVPKITKVVVNTGLGKMNSGKTGDDVKKNEAAIVNDLSLICGQKPVLNKAKKAIAGFKLREGTIVGASATLRKNKMNDFLERLIHITFPRSRDFQGIDTKVFDKTGNLTIGMKEHLTFSEIFPEKIRMIFGLEMTIVTSAKTKEEGVELLKLLGFPIKKTKIDKKVKE